MKEQLLYHALFWDEHAYHVPLSQIMNEGITPLTKSNYAYTNGGVLQKDTTERLRPKNTPEWVDFSNAIGVNIKKRFAKSVCFPVFTDKIMVFDWDISNLIEDSKDDVEDLIKRYWEGMMTLEEYLRSTPFKPEVLLFESVPGEIIKSNC